MTFLPMLLCVSIFIPCLFILAGYLFKSRIERKIQSVIIKKIAALGLTVAKIVDARFPDTGPFQIKYRTTRTNIMTSIMGLYPDYTAFRKVVARDELGVEKVYWAKIDFDIMEFKGAEIRGD